MSALNSLLHTAQRLPAVNSVLEAVVEAMKMVERYSSETEHMTGMQKLEAAKLLVPQLLAIAHIPAAEFGFVSEAIETLILISKNPFLIQAEEAAATCLLTAKEKCITNLKKRRKK